MYKRLFGDRDPVAEPGTATGTPGDWWTVFANSPDVLDHAVKGFGLYASPDRKVPAELRELGQTRAGWLVGSQFVFSQHCKSCRALGFPEEKIEALKAWPYRTCSHHWSGYDDRDDPIVEIAAPADYEAADIGRQISRGPGDNAS